MYCSVYNPTVQFFNLFSPSPPPDRHARTSFTGQDNRSKTGTHCMCAHTYTDICISTGVGRGGAVGGQCPAP